MRHPRFHVLILCLFIAFSANAADLNVNADGQGPYATIADAMAAANHGDRILLNPGTFTGPGNVDVTIYRNIEIRPSGNAGTAIIDCDGSAENPHRAFNFEYCTTLVYGLTVINGYAERGGAMSIEEGHVTLEFCVIRDNEAAIEGGAIYVFEEGALTLERTVIDANHAGQRGGGISGDEATTLTIDHSTLILNGAPNGGHVCLAADATASGERSLLVFAYEGGAVGEYYGGEIALTCSDVWGNHGGNWIGLLADQVDVDGNLSVDPELIDPMAPEPEYGPIFTSPIWTLNPCGWMGAVAGENVGGMPVYGLSVDGRGMFLTLQEAVDVVPANSTIMLEEGNYQGEGFQGIDLEGKNLTICSRCDSFHFCSITRIPTDDPSTNYIFALHDANYGNTRIKGLGFTSDYSGDGARVGAIDIRGAVEAEIINCKFSFLRSDENGAGIRIIGQPGTPAGVKLVDTHFSHCIAPVGGGLAAEHWTVDMENCSFSSCSADSGQAAWFFRCPSGEMRDCRFQMLGGNESAMRWEESGYGEFLMVGVQFIRVVSGGMTGHWLELINPGQVRLSSCEIGESRPSGYPAPLVMIDASYEDDHLVTFDACNFVGYGPSSEESRCAAMECRNVDVVMNECHITGFHPDQNEGLDNSGTIKIVEAGLTMTECTMAENRAIEGGALHLLDAHADLTDCVFRENHAAISGGAIYAESSSIYATYSNFLDNHAMIYGGAIAFEGNEPTPESTFDQVLIARNAAEYGGSAVHMYAPSSSMHFEQCTIAGNESPDSVPLNSQINILGGEISLYHSMVANASGASFHVENWTPQTFNIYCTNIWGNAGGDWIPVIADMLDDDENISADPMFCDADLATLLVHALSPCLPDNNACSTQIGARGQGCDGPVSGVFDSVVPTRVTLAGAYPNPFNPSTTLSFALPMASPVSLTIHDLAGRRVRTLLDGTHLEAGSHSLEWNGHDDRGRGQSSGVYLIRLVAGREVQYERMTLVR